MNRASVLFATTFVATSSWAQIGPATFETLEAKFVQSETVVIAHVIAAEPFKNEYNHGNTIVFQVDEVFRGKPDKTIRIDGMSWGSDPRPPHWVENKTSFLLMLPPDGKGLDHIDRTTTGGLKDDTRYDWQRIHRLETDEFPGVSDRYSRLPLFANDYRILDSKSAIEKELRAITKRTTGYVRVRRFQFPSSFASLVAPPGDGSYTVIAMTPQTEEMGFKMLTDPMSYMKRVAEAGRKIPEREPFTEKSGVELFRDIGRELLGEFPSARNIARVKPLLTDPTTVVIGTNRVYTVRKAAYDLLIQWGVAVERPVLEEPIKDAWWERPSLFDSQS